MYLTLALEVPDLSAAGAAAAVVGRGRLGSCEGVQAALWHTASVEPLLGVSGSFCSLVFARLAGAAADAIRREGCAAFESWYGAQ